MVSREKREANKRAREEEASAVEAALARGEAPPPSTSVKRAKKSAPEEGSSSNAAPAVTNPAADKLAVAALRKEARAALSRACTWDLLRDKRSPNGTSTSVRLERVEMRHYAALIGLQADPNLRSLVKKGAWFSVDVACDTFFEEEIIQGKGGKYSCNSQLGVRGEGDLSVKYSPAAQTMSIGFVVERTDF